MSGQSDADLRGVRIVDWRNAPISKIFIAINKATNTKRTLAIAA